MSKRVSESPFNISKRSRRNEIPGTSKEVQPQITWIGSYSIEKRKYKDGMSSIKYVKIPKRINFKLKKEEQASSKVDHDYMGRLNQILTFIQRSDKKEVIDGKPYDADFVCTRGVLRKVMEYAYFPDNFEIKARKFKNTIYLALKYINRNSSHLGYQFENCMVSSRPQDAPGIPEGREFCVVVKRILGDFKILFSVECDGIESQTIVKEMDDLKKASIIELKTRTDKSDYLQDAHFQWLIQSHVAGIVDKIYEGKRDEKEIVKKIELFDLEALEDEGKQEGWDINVCYTFLKNFLDNVKEKISNDENVFVYKFTKLKLGSNNIRIENNPRANSKSPNVQNRQNVKHSSPLAPAKSTPISLIPTPEIENGEILPEQYRQYINN